MVQFPRRGYCARFPQVGRFGGLARVPQPLSRCVVLLTVMTCFSSPGLCGARPPQFELAYNLWGVNSSADEGYPCISSDGLTLFFSSRRGSSGSVDLFMTTRESVGSLFQEPVPISNVNTTDHNESKPSISADGLTLFFYRSHPPWFGTADIMVSARSAPDAPFGSPALIPAFDGFAIYMCDPVLSPDGLELYMHVNRSWGTTGIHRATRSSPSGSFSTPVHVSEFEDYPSWYPVSFSGDGLTFFHRKEWEPDSGLYVARRAYIGAPFEEITYLPEFPGRSPSLSSDGESAYVIRDPPGGRGGLDIWIAFPPLSLPTPATPVRGWRWYR
jgi:hypothetical protein